MVSVAPVVVGSYFL